MFTEKEFDSAYEIVSGFNNICKQINEDPKLLTKLYETYNNKGSDVKNYSDVDNHFKIEVRNAVLGCYISLGYPCEYNRNIFEHFDLLSQVFLDEDKNLDYTEYENIWTLPHYAPTREFYEKLFNVVHYCPIKVG